MTVTSAESVESNNNGTPVKAQAEMSRGELFQWSKWVHAGAGAEECDNRFTGRCEEEGHFHAWIRLPNPFQVRDITEKARAARARKLKELRDEDSDARVVLEDQLYQLHDGDREILVNEIVDRDFPENYTKAVREVDSWDDPDYEVKDDEDIPKLYAHIDQDREEYERQRQLPEDQRDEGFERLERTLGDYGRDIEAEMAKLTAPRRQSLMERPVEDLVDIVRKARVEMIATEIYLHTYNTWQWFVCVFKPRQEKVPNERVWKDIAQMKYETPPEVVDALRAAFESLETRMAESRMAKN